MTDDPWAVAAAVLPKGWTLGRSSFHEDEQRWQVSALGPLSTVSGHGHGPSDILGIPIVEMLFIGDALFVGRNDRPAKAAGVVSIQVRDPMETKRVVEAIIACLDDA